MSTPENSKITIKCQACGACGCSGEVHFRQLPSGRLRIFCDSCYNKLMNKYGGVEKYNQLLENPSLLLTNPGFYQESK